MKKEALRVTTTIPAAPTTLYFAWLNAEQHGAMTGGAAKIDTEVGGKYTTLNGYLSGKLVTLDLGRRIVMSWRTADFPREDADSRVEMLLEALGGSTRVTVLHTDIPEGHAEKAREIWNEKYFAPMRTFFTKFMPDPRQPPPPRRPIPPEDTEEEEAEEEAPKKSKLAAKAVAKAAPPPKVAAKPAPSSKAVAKPAPSKAPAKASAPPPAPAAKAKAPAKPVAAKAPPAKPAKAPAATDKKTAAKSAGSGDKKAAPKKAAAKPAKGKKK